jgi:hypothetical protein
LLLELVVAVETLAAVAVLAVIWLTFLKLKKALYIRLQLVAEVVVVVAV